MNIKTRNQLIEKARAAARMSYAPYSKFRVGAALLVAGKKNIFTGGNVENASYGLTICAERAALAAAVSAGHRRFEAIAVAAPVSRPSKGRVKTVVPCGACLQALAEFCAPGMSVIMVSTSGPAGMKIYKLRDLLPRAFRL
jgi:cytidine deaminase